MRKPTLSKSIRDTADVHSAPREDTLPLCEPCEPETTIRSEKKQALGPVCRCIDLPPVDDAAAGSQDPTAEEMEVRHCLDQATALLESPLSLEVYVDEELPEHFVDPKLVHGEIERAQTYAKPLDAAIEHGLSEEEVTEVHEAVFKNGLRIALKRTDFFEDDIRFAGSSLGGYSELDLGHLPSAMQAVCIVEEHGLFGVAPETLIDMMAGKRISLNMSISNYRRSFGGDTSVSDVETALQLIHCAFTARYELNEDKVDTVKQTLREMLIHEKEDPEIVYENRVTAVNSSDCPWYAPFTEQEVDSVDGQTALDYFRKCFGEPSDFSVVFVGNIPWETLLPLAQQYLGSIPSNGEGYLSLDAPLTRTGAKFPMQSVREEIRLSMIEPQGQVSISLPFYLSAPSGGGREESVSASQQMFFRRSLNLVALICLTMDKAINELLRFEEGKTYNSHVEKVCNAPPPRRGEEEEAIEGCMTISFSCAHQHTDGLVDEVLARVAAIRAEGFDPEHVKAVMEAERRSHETQLKQNSYWLDKIAFMYDSALYTGSVTETFLNWAVSRKDTYGDVSASRLTAAFNEFFADRDRYTVVTLAPKPNVTEAIGQIASGASTWVHDAFGEVAKAFGPAVQPGN